MSETKLTQEAYEKLLESNKKLQEENVNLSTTIAGHEKTITGHVKTITELQGAAISTAATKTDKAKLPEKLVSHEKKKYKWALTQFILPGRGVIKAEDAALDKEIIAEILAIDGQGILKEQA